MIASRPVTMSWDMTFTDPMTRVAIERACAVDAALRPSGGKPKKLGAAMRRGRDWKHDQVWKSIRANLQSQFLLRPDADEYHVKTPFAVTPACLMYIRRVAAQEEMTVQKRGDTLVFKA